MSEAMENDVWAFLKQCIGHDGAVIFLLVLVVVAGLIKVWLIFKKPSSNLSVQSKIVMHGDIHAHAPNSVAAQNIENLSVNIAPSHTPPQQSPAEELVHALENQGLDVHVIHGILQSLATTGFSEGESTDYADFPVAYRRRVFEKKGVDPRVRRYVIKYILRDITAQGKRALALLDQLYGALDDNAEKGGER